MALNYNTQIRHSITTLNYNTQLQHSITTPNYDTQAAGQDKYRVLQGLQGQVQGRGGPANDAVRKEADTEGQ